MLCFMLDTKTIPERIHHTETSAAGMVRRFCREILDLNETKRMRVVDESMTGCGRVGSTMKRTEAAIKKHLGELLVSAVVKLSKRELCVYLINTTRPNSRTPDLAVVGHYMQIYKHQQGVDHQQGDLELVRLTFHFLVRLVQRDQIQTRKEFIKTLRRAITIGLELRDQIIEGSVERADHYTVACPWGIYLLACPNPDAELPSLHFITSVHRSMWSSEQEARYQQLLHRGDGGDIAILVGAGMLQEPLPAAQ